MAPHRCYLAEARDVSRASRSGATSPRHWDAGDGKPTHMPMVSPCGLCLGGALAATAVHRSTVTGSALGLRRERRFQSLQTSHSYVYSCGTCDLTLLSLVSCVLTLVRAGVDCCAFVAWRVWFVRGVCASLTGPGRESGVGSVSRGSDGDTRVLLAPRGR